MTQAIEQEQGGKLATQAASFLVQCETYKIEDADQYKTADDLISRGMRMKKTIEEVFKEPKKRAHEAHKAVVKTEKALIDPIEKGTKLLGNRMASWKREEDRKRREAEEAERRKADEARKKVEVEAKKNNLPPPVHQPELPPAVAVDTTPEVNIGYRDDWDIQVLDPGAVPGQYKEIRENWILADVRRARGKINIPGVKITAKQIPIRRAS